MDRNEVLGALGEAFSLLGEGVGWKGKKYIKGWIEAFVAADHAVLDAFDQKEREQKCMNEVESGKTMVDEKAQDYENTRMNDPVNHPAHYTSGKIEVIDFLEDQKFPFHLANAVKYISRAGKKDPEKTVQDLEKSIWYINRYIGLLQKAQDGSDGT